jgi:hypothetical protein
MSFVKLNKDYGISQELKMHFIKMNQAVVFIMQFGIILYKRGYNGI